MIVSVISTVVWNLISHFLNYNIPSNGSSNFMLIYESWQLMSATGFFLTIPKSNLSNWINVRRSTFSNFWTGLNLIWNLLSDTRIKSCCNFTPTASFGRRPSWRFHLPSAVHKENRSKLGVAVDLLFQKVVLGQIVLVSPRCSDSSERERERERA